MGTQLPETFREVEINILRGSVHLVASFEKGNTLLFAGETALDYLL